MQSLQKQCVMFISTTMLKDQVLYNAPDPDDEESTEDNGNGGGSGRPGGGGNTPSQIN